jgi:hypothetical protein
VIWSTDLRPKNRKTLTKASASPFGSSASQPLPHDPGLRQIFGAVAASLSDFDLGLRADPGRLAAPVNGLPPRLPGRWRVRPACFPDRSNGFSAVHRLIGVSVAIAFAPGT